MEIVETCLEPLTAARKRRGKERRIVVCRKQLERSVARAVLLSRADLQLVFPFFPFCGEFA